MSVIDVKDRVKCALTADITASQTLLPVGPGGQDFQAASGHATMAVIRDAERSEVVKVTGVSFGALTVERGQDGSTPRAFKLGAIVSMRPVESTLAQYPQKGVMRQVTYNPNAVLMPAYFGEKVAETGVEGCTHRIWQNVAQDAPAWRLVYGAPCKDLTNWRDWNWEEIEIPWQWWPWTPPIFEETPDLWLDASLYDFADGAQVSYPAGAPLGEDCTVFPTNPVYELISGNVFRSAIERDIGYSDPYMGHPSYFASDKHGGHGAIEMTVVENHQPFFGLYCDHLGEGVYLPSPAKTCILVASLDFSGGNDFWIWFGGGTLLDSGDRNGCGIDLSREGGNIKVSAGVSSDDYGMDAEFSFEGDSEARVFALRYNIGVPGDVQLFINGEEPGYTVHVYNPEEVVYEHLLTSIDFSGVNTYPGPTSPPGYTGTAYLCEYQIFDRWLTDEQIAAQTELLKKKWGIA